MLDLQAVRDMADTAGDKFSSCCREAGLTSACGEGWCTYPPTDPWTPWDIKCWGEHIQAFIQCYTQKRNNQVCCAQKDVTGAYSICQDLCNGNATQVGGGNARCRGWVIQYSSTHHNTLVQLQHRLRLYVQGSQGRDLAVQPRFLHLHGLQLGCVSDFPQGMVGTKSS